MPKVVDHDARRSTVVDAALEVIARSGLDAATMRAIADEAHCTTGLVTHYFASRDALIVGALRRVHGRSAARMARHVEALPAGDALAAVLLEALPLDGTRSAEWKVWLAFWGAAIGDPSLADENRRRYDEWRSLVGELVRAAVDAGTLRSDVDVRAETDRLVALVDGLGVQATLDPSRLGPRRLRTLVRGHLASLA